MEEVIKDDTTQSILEEFENFILDGTYPCVAARAALSRSHVPCLVVNNIDKPDDDARILLFIYDFVMQFRKAKNDLHSVAIIFSGPANITEDDFETFFWQRLQNLSRLDAGRFPYDSRVSSDPSSPDFSFSLAEEAFFIIGLHPASSRPSRKFKYPAMVFNPHAQFVKLRAAHQYDKMKNVVRKRDKTYSGNVNPMLKDFGEASETMQYTGRQYNEGWTCPLHITHGGTENNSAAK